MAELLGASVRRGVAGGRGGSERRRRVRSGVARQRAEEGGKKHGREGEGSRGWRGAAGDVPGEEEAARQGGAGLLGRARASTQLLLLAGGRRQEAPGGLGQRAGPATGRWPGSPSLSLSLLFVLVFYFFAFCFDLILKHQIIFWNFL